jgi:hypothetical protein
MGQVTIKRESWRLIKNNEEVSKLHLRIFDMGANQMLAERICENEANREMQQRIAAVIDPVLRLPTVRQKRWGHE